MFLDNMEKNPDWKEKLIDTHMRFCISPFHDKDVWSQLDIKKHPEREKEIIQNLGMPKKAHFHIMFHCDQNTTYKTMKDITEELDLPLPQICRSPYGMYRYFCHQDNPEKHQYDMNEITHFNGSDPSDYLMEMSKLEKQKIILDLINLQQAKGYTLMGDFLLHIQDHFADPRYTWIALTNLSIFKEILKDNLTRERYKKRTISRINKIERDNE